MTVLLEALVRMDDKPLLRLIGAGAQRAELERIVERHKLPVEFFDPVTPECVPDVMKELDVLVVPSITTARVVEQFGRVIVEAMAAGVPVVATDAGALPDVVGDAGLVVREQDPGALAVGLADVLGDRDKMARMSTLGRRRAREFTASAVASQILDLWSRVV